MCTASDPRSGSVIKIAPGVSPVTNFFRTSNLTGTISLPEGLDLVMPGDSVTFNVTLADFCPLDLGLRFIIREGTSTIGAGVITKLY